MRIAHVITRMIVGGAQENTLFTCRDLIDEHGDEVLLLTGPALGPEGDLLAQQGRGVPVIELPALRRAAANGGARVVNVTSNSYAIGRLKLDDLTFERFYWPLGPYSASKLGNIYFTRELARRLAGERITVNAVHPGLIFTNLGIGNNPGPLKAVLGRAWSWFSIDESEGYRGPTYAATHPELEGVTGRYIAVCELTEPKAIARRDDAARALWAVSEELTGERFTAA